MAMNLPKWDPADVMDASRGDSAAWGRLAHTWGPVVLRWCSFMGGNKIDPEDAAQQVFVVVWRRLGSLRDPQRFPSWLYGITRRVLADQRRSAWTRRWLPGVQPDRIDNKPSPERSAVQSELSRRVADALDHLNPKHRELLILCDLQGHTVAEAAEMIGIRLNTAKSRLIRGRQRFTEIAQDMGLDASSTEDPLEEAARDGVILVTERQP
jgi:RNA polymerase sigma factor (sigma-70 family)